MTKFLQNLGPGLLFAGAAIGVSHLVQSTKAGANFGFGLLWALLLINLIKYPFFQFGPRYAAATGESLLEGYNKLGKGVLKVYALLTIATMFTIQGVTRTNIFYPHHKRFYLGRLFARLNKKYNE